jgi:hypothetical protein
VVSSNVNVNEVQGRILILLMIVGSSKMDVLIEKGIF